jgi:thiamine-monophosphate kinase
MREFAILQHIYSAASKADARVVIGPGDDMGMVKIGGSELLAAVDQLIDGRHIQLKTTPLGLAGRKAITRSLSDIAAMAGKPVATLVAATLPPNFGDDRAKELFDSMRQTADRYQCPLIGGDIAFHNSVDYPMVCGVTVLAEPGRAGAITRGGAKAGDFVYVTGALGGSLEPNGLGRHLTFEPRIALALRLAEQLGDRLHAMIDISDGLGRDASHIASRSRVQILLDASRIPCNSGCGWQRALSDGEDYELCFAAKPPVPSSIDGVDIHLIGEVRGDGQHTVLVKHGEKFIDVSQFGWQHQSA